MPPRITIITPNFNHAAFLERAINSVFDQGYENLEYIVLDGGSTDGSQQIIERYADRLALWRSGPDGGQVTAINRGIADSTGAIIGYLNSDDYYLPGAFQTVVQALDGSPQKWAVGTSVFTGDRGPASGFTVDRWVPELPSGPRSKWLLTSWGVPQPSSFWRRQLFDDVGNFDTGLKYVFDTEHALRCVLAGELPEIVDGELAARFLHEDTKSATDDAGWAAERRMIQRKLFRRLGPAEKARYVGEAVLFKLGVYDAVGRMKANSA